MRKIRKAEFTVADYAKITSTTVKALRSKKPLMIPLEDWDIAKIIMLSKDHTVFTKKIKQVMKRYLKNITSIKNLDPKLMILFKELADQHSKIASQINEYFDKSSCTKHKTLKGNIHELKKVASAYRTKKDKQLNKISKGIQNTYL